MRSTLTFVLFFILISCNKSIDIDTKKPDKKIIDLKSYLSKQLLLQNQTQEILQKEADFNILYSKFQTVQSDMELRAALLASKIKSVDLLIELLEQQDSNLINFIQNDESGFFDKTNEEKFYLINSVQDSLSLPSTINNQSAKVAPPTCLQIYKKAIDRCRRDYAIAAGVSIGSIPWTLGAGILGWGVASLQLYFCESDAKDDYDDCED